MPAGSFFPQGFDAPGTRILPIHFCLLFFHLFLSSFLSPIFALRRSVDFCIEIVIEYYTTPTISTVQGFVTSLSHSSIG